MPPGDTLHTLGVLKGDLSESQTLAKELWVLTKQSKTQLGRGTPEAFCWAFFPGLLRAEHTVQTGKQATTIQIAPQGHTW